MSQPVPALRPADVLRTWWPLAASWMLMGVEMPMVAAALTRLDDAERHLAALGGLVFPLALVIEAPIIMMLAASTALCRDTASFRRLFLFMTRASALLTLVHGLVAFTPLFDLIATHVIGVPEETIEPGRIGLRIMLPWTWAIADRRFHQGVLIRFGHERHVGIGTIVRLAGTVTPLALGLAMRSMPGIVVAALAFSCGTLAEMAYVRWRCRVVRRGPLAAAPAAGSPLTTGRLWRFYVPLALTPLIALLSQPIGSAGISRMPVAFESLAIWAALGGLAFLLRSVGIAFNEVVVRHGDDAASTPVLGRMALLLGLAMSAIMLLVAATGLSTWWFGTLTGLEPHLTELARDALWWGVPLPLITFMHSYYQGRLVNEHRTRGITEAVVIFLVVTTACLILGVVLAPLPGASAAMAALTIGAAAQGAWLALRVRA